ncbi:PepSY domain-containing protein [Thiothrix litoralis]|uniref:PepSY domain-containing protein n=1 Tax=Thiothrix litoralis TaxID=2891210 RepID=A0ABX7WXE7_9GAMM|nr:PepSY domain-containing protein [Thiothrix litoralis]QTR46289.1 PepSY domain-containing protein [Thiothrix litoralis]
MKFSTKLAVVLLASSVLGTAYAAEVDDQAALDDLQAVTNVSVSMVDAINAALKEVPGVPAVAEFENSDGEGAEARWFIEIISGKAVVDLEVDAATGKVTRLADDPVDADVVESEDVSPQEVPPEKADK